MTVLTIIGSGTVFAPSAMGIQDVTFVGGHIIEIARESSYSEHPGAQRFDASGRYVVPAFVDAHLHVLGAGGAGEAAAPPLSAEAVFRGGTGTIVGCLGLDDVSLGIDSLLMHARMMQHDGVTAFGYTGGFALPPPTLLGQVRRDLALIDRLLGVKSTIGESLGAGFQSDDKIVRLCGEMRLGARLGGKRGVLHLHTGEDPTAFEVLARLASTGRIDPRYVVATHANRSDAGLANALKYIRVGGYIDLTATQSPRWGRADSVPPRQAVRTIIDAGAGIQNVSLSSDAGGPRTTRDGTGVHHWQTQPIALLEEWRAMVEDGVLDMPDALSLVTANPAERLGIPSKGRLRVGADADILVLDGALAPTQLWTLGVRRLS